MSLPGETSLSTGRYSLRLAAALILVLACSASSATARSVSQSAYIASRCTRKVVRTYVGPTKMRFVLHGVVSCATAHHVVRSYFAEGVAKCQGSGCFIKLPSGWSCE